MRVRTRKYFNSFGFGKNKRKCPCSAEGRNVVVVVVVVVLCGSITPSMCRVLNNLFLRVIINIASRIILIILQVPTLWLSQVSGHALVYKTTIGDKDLENASPVPAATVVKMAS